eukprot:4417072-Heterocapsa_arctica.AAC.1
MVSDRVGNDRSDGVQSVNKSEGTDITHKLQKRGRYVEGLRRQITHPLTQKDTSQSDPEHNFKYMY